MKFIELEDDGYSAKHVNVESIDAVIPLLRVADDVECGAEVIVAGRVVETTERAEDVMAKIKAARQPIHVGPITFGKVSESGEWSELDETPPIKPDVVEAFESLDPTERKRIAQAVKIEIQNLERESR